MVDGIYEDDNVLIIECNHSHNPWLTEELKLERDKMAARDPDRYMWIWEGKFRKRSDVKVLNGKWRIEEFTPDSSWGSPLYGADFGFAQDPSTLIRAWVHDERLWIEYEAYGVGVELDHMPAFYDQIPESRKYMISADCSRPETISYLKRQGFRIEGAEKWAGSVEDGIAHLRGYKEIIIHPRCRHAIAEANAYEYKVDKTTKLILPDVKDGNDHVWDAVRYLLHRHIRAIKKKASVFTRSR
jgi:phage terminase large subunit